MPPTGGFVIAVNRTHLANKVSLRHADGLVGTKLSQLGDANPRYRHIAATTGPHFAEEKVLLEEKAPETGAQSSTRP